MPKKANGICPHASPSASTGVPTTQPIHPLVQSLWKRLRNSTPEQVNCNWSEALLPVKLLCCPTCHARGSFPETLDLKSAWYNATQPIARRTLTAYPPGSHPPEGKGTPICPPVISPSIACSPGFGAAWHCPPSLHSNLFSSGLCLVFSSVRLLVRFGIVFVERFLGAIITAP